MFEGLARILLNTFRSTIHTEEITMRNLLRFIAAMAITGWVGSSQAGIITYDNRADWQAALSSSIVVDSFSNAIAEANTITFDSGVVSALVGGNPCCGDNSVSGGHLNMAVDGDGSVGALFNDWLFPHSIYAFGFDVVGVGAITGVQVTIDDGSGASSYSLNAVAGGTNGFVGFVSDSGTFDEIRFSSVSNSNLDIYDVDNLAFTPAPATLALFGLGLVGLGFSRRKRV